MLSVADNTRKERDFRSTPAGLKRLERIGKVSPSQGDRGIIPPNGQRAAYAAWLVVAALAVWAVPERAAADTARVGALYGAADRYRRVAESLAQRLRAAGHEYRLVELPPGDEVAEQGAVQQLADFRPTVIVAGGTTATVRALAAVPDVPVIFFMMPNAHDAPFLAEGSPHRRRVTGVSSDVDPAVQIRWITQTHARALDGLRCHPLGQRAVCVGRVTATQPPLVELVTCAGGRRIVQRPYGEELPRIC